MPGSQKPLLILSDSPSASTGLARITKDLATRICRDIPEFRVGTIGYGGSGSRNFPWPQYYANVQDWIPLDLPAIWEDFAGDEPGILFCIWDLARLFWIGQADNPEFASHPICQWLQRMRAKKKIKVWAYPAIDACGPDGGLAFPLKETALGFDRILSYSKWAKGILRVAGIDNTDFLPHGIDSSIWYRREIERRLEEFVVGIVATNQPRKDWALGIRTAAVLRDDFRKMVRLWIHTDRLQKHWDIPALLQDYGFLVPGGPPPIVSTDDISDGRMAECYSHCDVTLGIGKGEGFGYPLFESLACNVPVCAHHYSGYVEHIPEWMMVDADAYYYDGLYCDYRPVGQPEQWAEHIVQYNPEMSGIELPAHLSWTNLWPKWAEWLRRGL